MPSPLRIPPSDAGPPMEYPGVKDNESPLKTSVETWARTTFVASGEIGRNKGVLAGGGNPLGYGIEADCSLRLLVVCGMTERAGLGCRVTFEQTLDCIGVQMRKGSTVQK
ncbi:MAG: hypothetical protein Q9193_001763 [Seirophora villosa]